MALIRRHVPEGVEVSREHSLGGTVYTFNDQDEAEIDDPAALEVCAAFPDTFEVVGAAPPAETPDEAPGQAPAAAPGAFTEADLDPLTVADLQDIATGLNILGVRHMRKAELVEAILSQQRITGGH